MPLSRQSRVSASKRNAAMQPRHLTEDCCDCTSLQPASHEAQHGTVAAAAAAEASAAVAAAAAAAAAAGGTSGWLGKSMDGSNCGATDVLLLQMPCGAQTHATASAIRLCATQLQKSGRPGSANMLRQALCCTAPIDRNASRMTRVPVLEPGTRTDSRENRGAELWPPGRARVDGASMEGSCGSEIGRPALHAMHPLRLARKVQMHRSECPDTAAETRGYACTRSLEPACGKFSRRSTRGSREGGRPLGECRASPGVATRDSCYSGGGTGSAAACCRCDARVRQQQRGCGVPF